MSNAQHTPGPWHYRPVVHEIQAGPFNVKVAQMPMDGQGRSYDENLANAAIIAAAPDLLEACKQIVWKLSHNHDDGNGGTKPGTIDRRDATVRMARAAIAKAEA